MKKFVSLLLVAAVLLTVALPAGAAFSDVTDGETAQDVAILQLMGVIDGTGTNTFSPNGTLTRAQFCKMAVIVLGRADDEPLYRTRTIFPDVLANHWARGYINLAVSINIGAAADGTGGTQLIRGMRDGTFRPDRNITYAEAVTILLRMLGYSDSDAGMNWPRGYLELAANIGLTEGLNLSANDSLTRAQAAQLFVALLTTNQKSGSPYYNQLGSAKTGVVLMDANAKADDGTEGAMGTSAGTVQPEHGPVPEELVGTRGVLVTDEGTGRALAFVPVGRQQTVTVSSAQASWIDDRTGTRHNLTADTPAYTTTGSTTYGELWTDLRSGTQVTLYYSESGQVECLYRSTVASDEAAVARETSGDPFAALVEGVSDYTIYRDGNPASRGDIALFDVGTYDPATRILSVSSAKLTGRYEDVYPNEAAPSRVTVMGAELTVLPSAVQDMAEFRLGATVTLLLTADGQVAGAVDARTARADNLGVVTAAGSEAKVTLLNGVEISGQCQSTGFAVGQLVRVNSSGSGRISLGKVQGGSVRGDLSVDNRRIGTTNLNGGCRIFEQAGEGLAMRELRLEELLTETVPSSRIFYTHQDSNGKVDLLILDNVTGDLYTYGILSNGAPVEVSGSEGSFNKTIVVENGEGTTTPAISNAILPKNGMGGIALTADGSQVADLVTLTEERDVQRSDFVTRGDDTYVRLETQEMRVSDEVQCYNRRTGTWFASLAEARAFSDDLTVYYDRPAGEGGQVRIVVAE